MRIFISYASEDQAGFVKPLAEALQSHYEVWYSEYQLIVGISLLEQIDKGLRSCDYGVVVLSPSFFQKKWPRAELDGLFALETAVRKIILPIWKDISEEEVKSFSPILAGRFAANASDGVQKVVGDLRRSIEASNRAREIGAVDSVIQRARLLDQTLQEQANADRLSRCEEGVGLVQRGFSRLHASIESSIAEIRRTSKTLKLRTSYQPDHRLGAQIIVNANNRLEMHAELQRLGGNYTYEAVVVCGIWERKPLYETPAHNRIRKMSFKPTFNLLNEVLWIEGSTNRTHTTEELAAHLLNTLFTELEKLTRQG